MQRNQQWIDTMNWYWLVLRWLQCAAITCPTVFSAYICCTAEPLWAATPETVRYPAPRYNAYMKWAFLQATCVRQKKVVAKGYTHTHYKLQKHHKANRSVPKKQTHAWIVRKVSVSLLCSPRNTKYLKDCQSVSSLRIHWVCGAQRRQDKSYIQVTSI